MRAIDRLGMMKSVPVPTRPAGIPPMVPEIGTDAEVLIGAKREGGVEGALLAFLHVDQEPGGGRCLPGVERLELDGSEHPEQSQPLLCLPERHQIERITRRQLELAQDDAV